MWLIVHATSLGDNETSMDRRAKWLGEDVPPSRLRLTIICKHRGSLADLDHALAVAATCRVLGMWLAKSVDHTRGSGVAQPGHQHEDESREYSRTLLDSCEQRLYGVSLVADTICVVSGVTDKCHRKPRFSSEHDLRTSGLAHCRDAERGQSGDLGPGVETRAIDVAITARGPADSDCLGGLDKGVT